MGLGGKKKPPKKTFFRATDFRRLSENLFAANFSHILGHLKIVVFQNDVFGPSKILFYATNSNFHVHEK